MLTHVFVFDMLNRVYCEYNSLYDFAKERENSGEASSTTDDRTSFETAEDQVLHFLARAGRPRWKWMSVRQRSPMIHFGHNGATPIGGGHHAHHNGNNGQGSRKAEPYYCDRYLVQSLVRDAMVTDGLDQPSHPPRREDKQWVNINLLRHCIGVTWIFVLFLITFTEIVQFQYKFV